VNVDVLFAGIPVTDFDTALAWYERVFGRPPDVVAHDTEVMWRMTGSGWIYIIQDPERAGVALVALAVPDLDAVLGELAERGVVCGAVETVGDAGRKASVIDPERNQIEFLEVTSRP
jgi:predicted enzyme related to lactoylglutathione lyase